MKSAFVALEGACQSLFSSSFHSADTLTYHRKEWIQYSSWEASQNEFAHARSAFERAHDVDPWSVSLWLTYTGTQLKSRNASRSRNHSKSHPESECTLFSQFFCHVLTCPSRCCLRLVSPCSVGFFLCPDVCPSGAVSSRWVLLFPARSVSFCVLTYTDAVSRD